MSAILKVSGLTVEFPAHGGWARPVRALNSVDLAVERGQTLGIVGESGCGKSTLGFTVLMLQQPTAGRVVFDGVDLQSLGSGAMRRMRRRMQIVFQDAAASLDPRMPAGDALHQALDIQGLSKGPARAPRIRELLDLVGLPAGFAARYPHQLSGGQAQRVAIARALAVGPDLIVCDEPVSALDMSIQAQIVNLLQDLQRQLGLTLLFISHDLGVVRHISDTVAVMYLGRVVEFAPKVELFRRPLHPYTRALLSAVPLPDPVLERSRQRIILSGDLPSPADPPSGCVFRTRCPDVVAACAERVPPPFHLGSRHWVACIRAHETAGNQGLSQPVEEDATP